MTDNNIVKMINLITGKASRSSGGVGGTAQAGVDGVYLATVASVKPLSIRLQGVTVSTGLFINPALTLAADNAFQTSFEPAAAYRFLKEFHEKYVLKAGDTVVVLQSGSGFYIAGRAVTAG